MKASQSESPPGEVDCWTEMRRATSASAAPTTSIDPRALLCCTRMPRTIMRLVTSPGLVGSSD